MSQKAVVAIRDEIVAQAAKDAAGLAGRVASGDLSAAAFGDEMRKLIKTSQIAQYALGRGGVNAMTPSDRGALGSIVRDEFKALDGFIRDIQSKAVEGDAIATRAELYIDSSVRSYERGKMAAHGVTIEDAPPIHSRCMCHLAYTTNANGETVVTWNLGPRPCETCVALSARYQGVVVSA